MVREARSANRRWVSKLVGKFDLEDLKNKEHILEGAAKELIPKMVLRRRVEPVVLGTVSTTDLAGFFKGAFS